MDIIKELAAMCHEVFEGGSVQYAYTTIPTYPRCGNACAWTVLYTAIVAVSLCYTRQPDHVIKSFVKHC